MSEMVEWEVVHVAKDGLKRHTEGAQSRFGLTTARQIAKKLGEPWYVIHYHTMVNPEEHDAWLKGGGKRWSP